MSFSLNHTLYNFPLSDVDLDVEGPIWNGTLWRPLQNSSQLRT